MQRSDPGLGYEIGLHSSLTSHGLMGYGLMSSDSLRGAIALGEKYVQLRLPMLSVQQYVDADQAVIDVQQTAPLGPTRQCLFDLFLVGLARMAPSLIGQTLPPDEIELWYDFEQPDYYARYAKRLPRIRFDTGVNQLRFPARYLGLKLTTANPVTARMVEEQCRREMEQLGLAGDLVQQVRALLESGRDGYPGLPQVAKQLHMSERSLKRKLGEHGTNFRKMLDTLRYQDSIRLLKKSEMKIEVIAERLGYSDPANFTRAFRKWTGTTPSDFRAMQ